MQLWTIQSLEVWEVLRRDGVLRTTREHVVQSWQSEYNLPAYDWLREQMVERIGHPPEPDIYPIWAYFQFSGAKRRRPDLRTVRSWYPCEKQMVLLELRIEDKRVLLSDYHDWHYVLNDWYLASSEKESEAFDAANHPEEVARAMKLESWRKCLDMEFHAPDVSSPRDEKIIQATFWELRLEDVARVGKFTGRGNASKF